MAVLRAIGGFFVKIGRWIKETAWIQPLLIGGGIFAIIFSIPYISNWVSSWFTDSNASNDFYSNYKVSLSGTQNDDPNSDADKLFQYMDADESSKTDSDKNKWGEKFFLVFVQEDCSGCESIYKGFEKLSAEWNKGEFYKEGSAEKFKMHTIFIDTKEEVNSVNENLFQKYFFDHYGSKFEDIKSVMQDSNYVKNLTSSSSYLSDLETVDDPDSFASPTVFLYDPASTQNVTQLGVSEVLFTVTGKNNESGAYPIARTLFDCWYHQDIFSADYNS